MQAFYGEPLPRKLVGISMKVQQFETNLATKSQATIRLILGQKKRRTRQKLPRAKIPSKYVGTLTARLSPTYLSVSVNFSRG